VIYVGCIQYVNMDVPWNVAHSATNMQLQQKQPLSIVQNGYSGFAGFTGFGW